MIQTVVVPLDGSRRAATALGPAHAIAGRTGASISLLRASRDEDPRAVQEYLDGQATKLGGGNVRTQTIRDGLAALAILDAASDPASVVCMTTHGRSGVGHALLGSVAEAVLLGSNRPLFLIGPSLEARAWEFEHWFADGNALVTIDGSEASEAVLPGAAQWARLLGLRIAVAQVIAGAGRPDPVAIAPGAESAAVRRAAAAIGHEGIDTTWEVLHGNDVPRAILDYASGLPASLIALSTRGRTGLARVALGSVAMKVVRDSFCPVLVVCPDSQ